MRNTMLHFFHVYCCLIISSLPVYYAKLLELNVKNYSDSSKTQLLKNK